MKKEKVMRVFRDMPIRKKLILMMLITTTAVMMLASVIFIINEIISFRNGMSKELSTMGRIIGSNSISAITFNDPSHAETTLSALKAEPSIIAAAIYLKNGKVVCQISSESYLFCAGYLVRIEKTERSGISGRISDIRRRLRCI